MMSRSNTAPVHPITLFTSRPLLVRWALVSGAFLLGLSSLAVAFRQTLDFSSDVLMFGLIGACLVTTFAALLLPLRLPDLAGRLGLRRAEEAGWLHLVVEVVAAEDYSQRGSEKQPVLYSDGTHKMDAGPENRWK